MIELIVVISIVALLLSFSFPVVRDIRLFSDAAGQAGDIVRLMDDLKKRAVEKQVDFLMHVDTKSGRLWVSDAAMNDEERETAKEKGVRLSDGLVILDIEFPGIRETGPREHRIRFRKQGYSDFALIHLMDSENNITLKIEPFLSRVQVFNKHVYIEDCI